MYYIGIDIAKKLHTAAIKDQEGNQIGDVQIHVLPAPRFQMEKARQ